MGRVEKCSLETKDRGGRGYFVCVGRRWGGKGVGGGGGVGVERGACGGDSGGVWKERGGEVAVFSLF